MESLIDDVVCEILFRLDVISASFFALTSKGTFTIFKSLLLHLRPALWPPLLELDIHLLSDDPDDDPFLFYSRAWLLAVGCVGHIGALKVAVGRPLRSELEEKSLNALMIDKAAKFNRKDFFLYLKEINYVDLTAGIRGLARLGYLDTLQALALQPSLHATLSPKDICNKVSYIDIFQSGNEELFDWYLRSSGQAEQTFDYSWGYRYSSLVRGGNVRLFDRIYDHIPDKEKSNDQLAMIFHEAVQYGDLSFMESILKRLSGFIMDQTQLVLCLNYVFKDCFPHLLPFYESFPAYSNLQDRDFSDFLSLAMTSFNESLIRYCLAKGAAFRSLAWIMRWRPETIEKRMKFLIDNEVPLPTTFPPFIVPRKVLDFLLNRGVPPPPLEYLDQWSKIKDFSLDILKKMNDFYPIGALSYDLQCHVVSNLLEQENYRPARWFVRHLNQSVVAEMISRRDVDQAYIPILARYSGS